MIYIHDLKDENTKCANEGLLSHSELFKITETIPLNDLVSKIIAKDWVR